MLNDWDVQAPHHYWYYYSFAHSLRLISNSIFLFLFCPSQDDPAHLYSPFLFFFLFSPSSLPLSLLFSPSSLYLSSSGSVFHLKLLKYPFVRLRASPRPLSFTSLVVWQGPSYLSLTSLNHLKPSIAYNRLPVKTCWSWLNVTQGTDSIPFGCICAFMPGSSGVRGLLEKTGVARGTFASWISAES